MTRTYLTVDWDRLHRDTSALVMKLRDLGPFKGIVAVSRGGLASAAIVAYEMDIRLVECVSVATYDDQQIGKPEVVKPPVAAGDGSGFLIVDDLVDTGTTARVLRGLLPNAHYACLYVKPAGAGLADTHVAEVPQDTWILFPWDAAP